MPATAEHLRLEAYDRREVDWKHWGPYLSERAWGTVREDYSFDGKAWDSFPHDHARSRAYRWNEDGLAGFCNRFQNLCLAIALWNGHDPILKERLFGLSGTEGNHGEDVKEYYFYLDSTPTHSYCKMLYKYPQAAFPYDPLVSENVGRGKHDPEFELLDALYDDWHAGRYFDVVVEYAKAGPEDILCRVTATNRGPDAAPLHILPHVWFRNTWSWGYDRPIPALTGQKDGSIALSHLRLGDRRWAAQLPTGAQGTLLFTDNNTNFSRLFGQPNPSLYVKDGINDAIVDGRIERVNPDRRGTKAAAHFFSELPPGGSVQVQVSFSPPDRQAPFESFDEAFAARIEEADAFYESVHKPGLSPDERLIQRQAFAGLLWTKQLYHYGVEMWLNGDPAYPPPPPQRKLGRNRDWKHLYALDVISMPDAWEYPWFAAWDLAFHMLPISLIDPKWAKRQLILMMREWYMHPNGQLPAYEWKLDDVNPPVHAWACWRVYKIARNVTGQADVGFLARAFHKLLLNFTWWINRKDLDGNNVFQGGFLGLDNIGVFDRSAMLPGGGHLDQADGTAWMGMFCLNMLAIALELARYDEAYEDVATKFFEHFIYIADAITHIGQDGEPGLWNAEDGFFYDRLHLNDGSSIALRSRSFVGLIPLFAVETIGQDTLERLPRFKRRLEWFMEYRPRLADQVALFSEPGQQGRLLLSIVDRDKLRRVLGYMFDPEEFLSDYGLRSLSKVHEAHPYVLDLFGERHEVRYTPAESDNYLFGGNSNWRGPIWFPVNYLMVETLQKYHHYYGDSFTIEYPTGSGNKVTLQAAAADLSRRLVKLFVRNRQGKRPVFGGADLFHDDPHWRDLLPFYEYFHGDNGSGIGASHQTGWTALVAKLIQQSGGDVTAV